MNLDRGLSSKLDSIAALPVAREVAGPVMEAVAARSEGLLVAQTPEGMEAFVDAPMRAVDVTSLAFKTWFGESHVREPLVSSRQRLEDAAPLMVFHGTNREISDFEVGRPGTNTYGLIGPQEVRRAALFFAENGEFASTFAESHGEPGAQVLPVYLRIERPFYMDGNSLSEFYAKAAQDLDRARDAGDSGAVTLAEIAFNRARYLYNAKDYWEIFDDEGGQDFVAWLQSQGYDGAFLIENGEGLGDDAESQNTWVVFSPSQVKSALSNTGGFDPTNPDIRS